MNVAGVNPRLLEHTRGHAAVLAEQREGQMLRLDLRLAVALRKALGLADCLLGLLGQSVGIPSPRSSLSS